MRLTVRKQAILAARCTRHRSGAGCIGILLTTAAAVLASCWPWPRMVKARRPFARNHPAATRQLPPSWPLQPPRPRAHRGVPPVIDDGTSCWAGTTWGCTATTATSGHLPCCPTTLVGAGHQARRSTPDHYRHGHGGLLLPRQHLFGRQVQLLGFRRYGSLASIPPPNVGLTGNGMTGEMEAKGTHFAAEGSLSRNSATATRRRPIPISSPRSSSRVGGIQLCAQHSSSPVSTEMHCDNCHKGWRCQGIRTGSVEQNILVLHDKENADEYPNGHTGWTAGPSSAPLVVTPQMHWVRRASRVSRTCPKPCTRSMPAR